MFPVMMARLLRPCINVILDAYFTFGLPFALVAPILIFEIAFLKTDSGI